METKPAQTETSLPSKTIPQHCINHYLVKERFISPMQMIPFWTESSGASPPAGRLMEISIGRLLSVKNEEDSYGKSVARRGIIVGDHLENSWKVLISLHRRCLPLGWHSITLL